LGTVLHRSGTAEVPTSPQSLSNPAEVLAGPKPGSQRLAIGVRQQPVIRVRPQQIETRLDRTGRHASRVSLGSSCVLMRSASARRTSGPCVRAGIIRKSSGMAVADHEAAGKWLAPAERSQLRDQCGQEIPFSDFIPRPVFRDVAPGIVFPTLVSVLVLADLSSIAFCLNRTDLVAVTIFKNLIRHVDLL
jgi:hypothetical protein